MARPQVRTAALVLGKSLSGEHHLHLHLLTPEQGLVHALQRVSRSSSNKAATTAADFLDSAHVTMAPPPAAGGESTLFFIRDYEVTRRRLDLARNYRSFQFAGRYAQLLVANARHLEEHRRVFHRSTDILDAFEETNRPEAVYLKAVFLFAREEGFPVKESWWRELPGDERAEVAAILNSRLQDVSAARESIERIIDELERWLRGYTDILV